ncbi:hypothetical protein EDB86DRAFT_3101233 [Lactarius hatsudake]|nr:hypothetical protein EDB86DRAFT_3101233 [Lactarius hatsudake]
MPSDFGPDTVPSLTPAAPLSALGLTGRSRPCGVNKTDIETLHTPFGVCPNSFPLTRADHRASQGAQADTAQMAHLPDLSLKKVARLKDVRVALPYTPSMAYVHANETGDISLPPAINNGRLRVLTAIQVKFLHDTVDSSLVLISLTTSASPLKSSPYCLHLAVCKPMAAVSTLHHVGESTTPSLRATPITMPPAAISS